MYGHKGSRKNNFIEFAPEFGLDLDDPMEQNRSTSRANIGFSHEVPVRGFVTQDPLGGGDRQRLAVAASFHIRRKASHKLVRSVCRYSLLPLKSVARRR
ncbi:MAG: hypothetical protein MAG794_00424 [Gammaproteobacteria bacterium]|nr:hypothetical protein [Gammaproteobacteria bacterium]